MKRQLCKDEVQMTKSIPNKKKTFQQSQLSQSSRLSILWVILLGVQDLCLFITINRAIFRLLKFIGMLVYVLTVTCVYVGIFMCRNHQHVNHLCLIVIVKRVEPHLIFPLFEEEMRNSSRAVGMPQGTQSFLKFGSSELSQKPGRHGDCL